MREFAPRDGSQGNDFSYYSNQDAHEESRSVTKAAAVKGLDVYRHVVLPPEVAKLLPKNRLLSEHDN
ncbi:hypothetical protein L6452_29489 [Arctium lappa]|uniref:Uncharacterized protein n=1 Tax=Arctium lappa TaxID=4217 RepID=A0ACB8ZGV8_ARCLA|nr:hypothetical protein L6452_29489 [Arctium lappa]